VGWHINAGLTYNANENKSPILRCEKQHNGTQLSYSPRNHRSYNHRSYYSNSLQTFKVYITMTDTDERKLTKTITLAKLHPPDFRIWLSTAEVTFAVYDCLNIVNGTELNPALSQAPGATTPANRKINASWTNRHALAREALLRSLERSELIKVHDLPLAADIWARLKEEYGAISDALRLKHNFIRSANILLRQCKFILTTLPNSLRILNTMLLLALPK
jgi:hypothetical protein